MIARTATWGRNRRTRKLGSNGRTSGRGGRRRRRVGAEEIQQGNFACGELVSVGSIETGVTHKVVFVRVFVLHPSNLFYGDKSTSTCHHIFLYPRIFWSRLI